MVRGLSSLVLLLALACGENDPKATAPLKATVPPPAKPAAKPDAAVPVATTYIKAQLNDRLVTFDQAGTLDNYIAGRNLRLRATTVDGEVFEIIGTQVLPAAPAFPLVLNSSGDTKIMLRYTTGLATEWSDTAPTLRIESFDDGRMIGSFHSKLLRPNKPAVPIRISGGLFDLKVRTRAK